MDNYTVYMHVSPNGKRYVGITKQNPEARWMKGRGYSGNEYFSKAIKKYGWDNFSHIILFSGLSKNEAEDKEIELIKFHKSNQREFGYNIQNGGNCCGTHSEETRKKIGAKSKGNKACLGRKISKEHIQAMRAGREKNGYRRCKHSEETKKKISESHKGITFTEEHKRHLKENRKSTNGVNNPMYGKHHSESTKKLISQKNKGRELTEEQKSRLRDIPLKRKVVQFDENWNEICSYDSLASAARAVGACPQNIGAVCMGKQYKSKGFYWRYVDDNS